MDKFWRWVVNEAEEPTVRTRTLKGTLQSLLGLMMTSP